MLTAMVVIWSKHPLKQAGWTNWQSRDFS